MKEHELPVAPLKSRISLFAVEYGIVDVDGSALVITDKNGVRAQFPVGATAVLMLEPGTSITHAAVKLCAENKTLIIWTGEGSVRLYSATQEGATHTYRLLRQARLALDPKLRLAVAREMYRIRFREEAPLRRSVEQLRGMEGARVRSRYKELSEQFGVPWRGRNYDQSDWGAQDPINRAVSAANSCLYGLCHAAILISGYSAAIGFIHTGYPLAFVHDLADIYKMDLSVPVAFRVVAESEENVAMRARHLLRDEFRRTNLLERIIPAIESLLDAGDGDEALPDELGGARKEIMRVEEMPWYTNQNGPNSERADAAALKKPVKGRGKITVVEIPEEVALAVAGSTPDAADATTKLPGVDSSDEDEWNPFTNPNEAALAEMAQRSDNPAKEEDKIAVIRGNIY